MKNSYIINITTAALSIGAANTFAGEKYTIMKALGENKSPLVQSIPADRHIEFLESRVAYIDITEGTPAGAVTLMMNEDKDPKTPTKAKYDIWLKDNTIKSIRKRGIKIEDQFTGASPRFELGDIVAGEDFSKETTDSSILQKAYVNSMEFPDKSEKGNVLFIKNDNPSTPEIEHEAKFVIQTDVNKHIKGVEEVRGILYAVENKDRGVVEGWSLETEQGITAPPLVTIPAKIESEEDNTSKIR